MTAVYVYWVLLCFCFSARLVAGDTKPSECLGHRDGELRLQSRRVNSTCGFVTGRIEICNGGFWKEICDSDWTMLDARVACRQLNYSSIEANTKEIELSINNPANFVPECKGLETRITDCTLHNSTSCPTSTALHAGVACFLNDSSVNICSNSAATTMEGGDPITTTEQEDSTQPSSSPTNVPTNKTTTIVNQAPTNFSLTSPIGAAVIAVIVSIIFLAVLVLVIILVLVCRRSPTSKREQTQVSPQTPKDLFKDDSDGKPSLFVYDGSPGQSRHAMGNVDIPEHHFIEQGPLYERVKDVTIPVAPPSVSSHDSGRSTTTSETNLPPNYSTLDRNELPTYSTLERSQNEYAQVQPFINNGSLTRGVTLQTAVDSEDHYHVLDRSTSQGSNFRRLPTSTSPKTRSKANTSPSQNRGHLPSITDDQEEIPEYAELDTPVEGNGLVPTKGAVSAQRPSPELPPRRSPGQYRHHSSSISGRPVTHEHVSPKRLKKSSTLPNTGRAGVSVPPSQRWSGTLDPPEHSNGLRTLVEGRLTSSNQERIPNSSWV